jgi:AraC-like DNA-binding protein
MMKKKIRSSGDSKGKKQQRLNPAIAAAVKYIEACSEQSIKLADIAYAAKLSAWRLGHLFVEEMGMTPIEYLNGVRIEHAKRLLSGTDYSGTKISYLVGYNGQSYFIRAFKRREGMTPEQFRQSGQKPLRNSAAKSHRPRR